MNAMVVAREGNERERVWWGVAVPLFLRFCGDVWTLVFFVNNTGMASW